LALAQAWIERGGAVTLASASPGEWAERYRQDGAVVAGPELAGADVAGHWVVLDGYRFDPRDQDELRAAGARVLVIDDHGSAGRYSADVVLDQNLDASADAYADRHDGTDLLLGTRYALLRREFRPFETWERDISAVARRLLVSLGGAPVDSTLAVVRHALRLADPAGLEVVWLRGGGAVPAEMAAADIALSASGSICWELCFMGLPAVLLSTSSNQVPLATAMAAHGAAVNAGGAADAQPNAIAAALQALARDAKRRADIARRGRRLVDGRGASRVVAQLRAAMVDLRPAAATDARLLWTWANDPAVRHASFSVDPIPWESHEQWLASKLADPRAYLYIGIASNGSPLGQVRFEMDGQEAEIHVSLAADWRGGGWGGALVAAGVRRLLRETDVAAVRARIKAANRASVSAFEAAGFSLADDQPADCLHYIRPRLAADG
jgi:spore coat polysaccharide biosynthesis predicted glycosyltransferase SpsG/RimJ/RimL family protein N-acetyltransferase